MLPAWAQKNTRPIRPSLRLVRISQSPLRPLSERQSGMPIGQPNSAVLISSPIVFLLWLPPVVQEVFDPIGV
jgi:hypothetical protein